MLEEEELLKGLLNIGYKLRAFIGLVDGLLKATVGDRGVSGVPTSSV